MTVEVLPVALVVTVLVVMTATAAEVLHLATMTIVETPTLVLLHPALAVLRLTITHRPEAVLILLMMAMVHLLQPAATRLTLTPTVTAESLESPGNPESLTAVLPALPRDASVATTQAMIVDLTGDYPLLLILITKTSVSYFRFWKSYYSLMHKIYTDLIDRSPPQINKSNTKNIRTKGGAQCGLVGRYLSYAA